MPSALVRWSMARIVVIGAGVIGLTTALALEQDGHEVVILAKDPGDSIVSFVAGAVWYPFKVGPVDKVPAWAAATRTWMLELARTTPEAGIDLLTRFELANDDARPWWASATPDLELVRELHGQPLPKGATHAWKFAAPRAEPRLFMAWLAGRLRARVRVQTVSSLRETLAAEHADALVNCTGLAARALTDDRELVGVYGQVVITEPGSLALNECLGDERDEREMFYTIPRRSEVVLGGCAEPSPDDRPTVTTPEMTQTILRRAAQLGLQPGRVIRERAGLRPFRPSVRLEHDREEPRIVHNYGHGGAGYTLCWGCAQEVVRLLKLAR